VIICREREDTLTNYIQGKKELVLEPGAEMMVVTAAP
jgi:hypothetical protein